MSRRMIALNNNGVNSLYYGRYNDAILSFRHSIECVKSLVYGESKEVSCSPTDSVEVFRSPLDCVEPLGLSSTSPNNMFDVYQGAFYLPKTDSVDHNVPEVSVVILYNLALAHHLAGLVGTDNCEAHLMEGQRYYMLALATYRTQPECTTVNRLAMVLGCVTNLGHIFSHFWRLQEAQSCCQMLDRMLESSQCMSLSEEDAEFFFTTLTYCSTQKCNLAPAA